MFIICNPEQATKKSFKKVPKIIISEELKNVKEDQYITIYNQFLPKQKLFNDFVNGDIGYKEYRKKYIKNIEKNEELYASLVLLLMVYEKKKDIIFVATNTELELGYIQFLSKYLIDKFEVTVLPYKDWKKKGKKLGKCDINRKSLIKAVKEYGDIITGSKKFIKDVKKKTKKDKQKKKKKTKEKFNALSVLGQSPNKDTDDSHSLIMDDSINDFFEDSISDLFLETDGLVVTKKLKILKIKRLNK